MLGTQHSLLCSQLSEEMGWLTRLSRIQVQHLIPLRPQVYTIWSHLRAQPLFFRLNNVLNEAVTDLGAWTRELVTMVALLPQYLNQARQYMKDKAVVTQIEYLLFKIGFSWSCSCMPSYPSRHALTTNYLFTILVPFRYCSAWVWWHIIWAGLSKLVSPPSIMSLLLEAVMPPSTTVQLELPTLDVVHLQFQASAAIPDRHMVERGHQ